MHYYWLSFWVVSEPLSTVVDLYLRLAERGLPLEVLAKGPVSGLKLAITTAMRLETKRLKLPSTSEFFSSIAFMCATKFHPVFFLRRKRGRCCFFD
jgi:hypothetical protein